VAVILASQVLAQSSIYRLPFESQNILLDYAVFPSSESNQVRLEVYYQTYNSALPFRQVGKFLEAEYEVAIEIVNNDGQPVVSRREDREVRVADITQAHSRNDYRIGQVNFEIPAGKYELVFVLSDKHSDATIRRELKLRLKSFKASKPKLSDIELVLTATVADSVRNDFFKANMDIIPSLSKQFGAEDDACLMFYLEIYRGTDSYDKVTVETVLRHNRHGVMYRDTLQTILDKAITCQLKEISIKEFRAGKYELNVQLHGRRGKKLSEKKVILEVPWNQTTLLKYEYKEAVAQLEFIAEPGETKKLKAISDYEERLRAFNEFWAERDPNPSTPINELKVRFYYRINTANKLFTIMGHQGWRTDRGRILIQYGEPDQIDDYPFALNQPPYQQWHYYEQGPYRKFTFVDKNEDGDYRLVYPYNGLDQRPDF